MSTRSISRTRIGEVAWVRLWTDRPPPASFPALDGPNPTFDSTTGLFRPWDWVKDPDWADFNTPWRPFIPSAPPAGLVFTSDMNWAYLSHSREGVARWDTVVNKYYVPGDVTGSYARAKAWLESHVITLRQLCHVTIPPPPPLRSAVVFNALRRDSPEALEGEVWRYRRDLLDWFGYFQWALLGCHPEWPTQPAFQSQPTFLDFATRYLYRAPLRGVSINTAAFPSWPEPWRQVSRRWLALEVPINYPWNAAFAEDRRFLELRPSTYPASWRRLDCTLPKMQRVLADHLDATSGLRSATNEESKIWHSLLHYREYANVDDYINIRVHYRAAPISRADPFDDDNDDDELPEPKGRYQFRFATLQSLLRDSPAMHQWRLRQPRPSAPAPPRPNTPAQPDVTSSGPASASTTVPPTPVSARVSLPGAAPPPPATPTVPTPTTASPPADTDDVSLGSADDIAPSFAAGPAPEGSSLTQAGPDQGEAAPPPEGFPLGSTTASTSAVQLGGSSPELEAAAPSPQALAEPSPESSAPHHDEPVSDQDIEMTAADSVTIDPPQTFSAFWATVTANNDRLATTHEVAPGLFFGIAWEFLSEITVSIPPLTEARLIQAMERNPSHSTLDLVKLMLRLGMRFHVAWSPEWGASWTASHLRGTQLPLPTYLADAPRPLGPATIPPHELCARYMERAEETCRRPCNARLLRYGGLIWRIVMQFGGEDLAPDVLSGPAATYVNNDWFFTGADGSHCDNSTAWQDDPVVTEILGTSPYNQAPTLWPNPDSWERGVAWAGRWNARAEHWFARRWSDIIVHVAKPHSPKTWREELRGHNSGVRKDLNMRLELPARLPQMRTAALSQLADSPLTQQGRLALF